MSIEGDEYVKWVAATIRKNERKLSQGLHQKVSPSYTPLSSLNLLPGASLFTGAAGTGSPPSSSSSSSSSSPGRGSSLGLDPHHLFYLLLRCESLGIDVGPLDLEAAVSYNRAGHGSGSDAKRQTASSVDTVSLSSSSVASTMSRLSLGEPSSWLGLGGSSAPDKRVAVERDLKYVYASMTKIPALALTSQVAANGQLIKGFEDTPYHLENKGSHLEEQTDSHGSAVPLYCFKNCTELSLKSLHPRLFVGWDGLAEQLTSLTLNDCGVDDLEEIFIDAVRQDMNRRRMHAGRSSRGISGPSGSAFTDATLQSPGRKNGQSSQSDPSIGLPPSKWRFLRHLDLHNSALTFIPTRALSYLPSLTHLDLSSNLLVSIPTGLALLSSLRSLNLRDNMIDSVLGVFKILGNVNVINLGHNRLASLCGLERLYSVERIDLRSNKITDITEVSRLQDLPSLNELWISDNPFTRYKKDFRVELFNMFASSGLAPQIDGSLPTMLERQRIQPLRKTKEARSAREKLPRNEPGGQVPRLTRTPTTALESSSEAPSATRASEPSLGPSLSSEADIPKKVVSKSRAKKRHVVFEDERDKQTVPVPAESNEHPQAPVSATRAGGTPSQGAHAFRERIERLREEQGDNWLYALTDTGNAGATV